MCDLCGDAPHETRLTRRGLLAAGAALALAPWAARAQAPKPNAIAPADALRRLMDGNARYAANSPKERDFSSTRAARAQGQYPIAAVLSCADSRVVPDLVFDQSPGDLFVCRVAGNIVTRDLLASLEYGVQFLGTPLILVVGHSACGAVDAAIKVAKSGTRLPGHLPDLVTAIKPAVAVAEKAKTGALLDNAIAENVRGQVARLKSAAPIVQKAYADRKVDIAGGVYDIATGKVSLV
jgi:carbonic anhydrase